MCESYLGTKLIDPQLMLSSTSVKFKRKRNTLIIFSLFTLCGKTNIKPNPPAPFPTREGGVYVLPSPTRILLANQGWCPLFHENRRVETRNFASLQFRKQRKIVELRGNTPE
ncbi:hypothetical protein NIES4071_76430 [Calothrix sp. NIES-4071]|nr:hypothetical protein NIES4071_76430 [Calothrix sp. NIES-4071]BAZ61918.1 hypothetical protein NIES4105_76380 [Calothrix sp. NIES-4105]